MIWAIPEKEMHLTSLECVSWSGLRETLGYPDLAW
jgi:hypothetical protein